MDKLTDTLFATRYLYKQKIELLINAPDSDSYITDLLNAIAIYNELADITTDVGLVDQYNEYVRKVENCVD